MKSLVAREDTDMTHLTTLDELEQHIALLASVEESGAPFISAYVNLESGQASHIIDHDIVYLCFDYLPNFDIP